MLHRGACLFAVYDQYLSCVGNIMNLSGPGISRMVAMNCTCVSSCVCCSLT